MGWGVSPIAEASIWSTSLGTKEVGIDGISPVINRVDELELLGFALASPSGRGTS
jgi:hypothetical protein